MRHKTWAVPLDLKALRDENIAFCNIDQTRLGETLEGTDYVTAPVPYLRLHGRSKEWFTAKNRDARSSLNPKSIGEESTKEETRPTSENRPR